MFCRYRKLCNYEMCLIILKLLQCDKICVYVIELCNIDEFRHEKKMFVRRYKGLNHFRFYL